MCGEKSQWACAIAILRGSPPRVRGKDGYGRRWSSLAGITPACAGKRSTLRPPEADAGDHPRVCGEKSAELDEKEKPEGSPPRVRGKAFSLPSTTSLRGITPARAGKSPVSTSSNARARDHPRACGEKANTYIVTPSKVGSPPRVRGKGAAAHVRRGDEGITPARAGKSRAPTRAGRTTRDHPRACGEKALSVSLLHPKQGSPPRVRGKVDALQRRQLFPGITPARAGKRQNHAACGSAARDHPRACGEKRPADRQCARHEGSPPRVRGKVPESALAGDFRGITPARAGKRAQPIQVTVPVEDHPRACGEKFIHASPLPQRQGSPPRVRGKANWNSYCPTRMRITPARAGKRCPVRR